MSLRLSGTPQGEPSWHCMIGDHMFTMEELYKLKKLK